MRKVADLSLDTDVRIQRIKTSRSKIASLSHVVVHRTLATTSGFSTNVGDIAQPNVHPCTVYLYYFDV